MKRYNRILAAVLGMSMIALAGCGNRGGDMGDAEMMAMMGMMEEAPGISVEVAYPTVRTISQSGSYIGTIETGDKVSVTPRVGGYIKAKYFGLGDVVNAGDVLFTIDDTTLRLEKEKAEADVRDANAALAKDKAENEATKYEVNETLGTLDTKTQENNNNIQKAIRTEYESQLDLYKICEEENKNRKEGEYLEDLVRKDKDSLKNAKEFTKKLSGFKSIYNKIENAPDDEEARSIAIDNGVSEKDIPDGSSASEIADIYLEKKTIYEDVDELDEAIASSEQAEKTAETNLDQHEGSVRNNDIAIVGNEVSAEKERGNIASAQEDIALKRKIAADYEIYTKAKIWAESQAKLAAGNSTVLSASSRLSKAQIDLEIASMKLDNMNVKSPVSGEIVECKIEDFGVASESSPAYTIIDTSKKKAVFYVTGDAKNNMSPGQKVTIDKGGEQYSATVDNISDTPDEKKLLYRITAILAEEDKEAFDAGMNIRLITDIKKSSNAVTVPIGVIYYDEGRAFIYVARDGIAHKVLVETGVDDGKDMEIVSGLTADDQIIVNWSEQLQDKIAVTVSNTPVKPEAVPDVEEETKNTADTSSEDTKEAGSSSDAAEVYVETTTRVNIRKDPTTDCEVLTTADTGERFLRIGEEPGGWIRIIYDDGEAFVKSDYVRECE